MVKKQHTRQFDNLNNEAPIIFNEVFGVCMGTKQQQQLLHLSFSVAYCPVAEKILACPGTYGKQMHSPSDVPLSVQILMFCSSRIASESLLISQCTTLSFSM